MDNPTIMMRVPRDLARRPGPLRIEENTSPTQTLVLPQNAVIKLAVMLGARPGTEFELSRPLMTIGRLGGGADIEVDDPEVSRLHCSIEVRRDAILLQDLHSKNGTFIADARVFASRIDESTSFRVGTTVLRIRRIAV